MNSSPKVTFADLYDYIESMGQNIKIQTIKNIFAFNQNSAGAVGEYFKSVEIRSYDDEKDMECMKDTSYMHSPYYFQIIYRSTDTTINRKYDHNSMIARKDLINCLKFDSVKFLYKKDDEILFEISVDSDSALFPSVGGTKVEYGLGYGVSVLKSLVYNFKKKSI